MKTIILLALFLPALAGIMLFLLKPLQTDKARNVFTGLALCVSTGLTLLAVFAGFEAETLKLWNITETISMSFRIDGVSRIFACLMSFMMTVVGFYAMKYMEHEENKSRFFAFYLLTFSSLNGIYMASNLLTMYFFYEFMTLLSLPMVLHEQTKEAIQAGYKYLFYSVGGAFFSLLAVFCIYHYSLSPEFIAGGFIDKALNGTDKNLVLLAVFVAVIGFGCKAGLFPLHGWLPVAHPVAPAPASAIMSGIITKSGVMAIIRVVFYSVGADFIRGTWVQYSWMTLTLITVFMGSMLAYTENGLKKRLAYSSVSQLSYVLFGLSTLTGLGFVGALLHVVFHSIIKNDLFLTAGAIIHNTGYTKVDQLRGIGKRMPLTMWSYTFASLALIGIPPACGFISKWFLAEGALSAQIGAFAYIGPAVLLVSALLTAGYLLPITIKGFLPGNDFDPSTAPKCEASKLMLVPMIILGCLTILLGIFPGIIQTSIEAVVSSLML